MSLRLTSRERPDKVRGAGTASAPTRARPERLRVQTNSSTFPPGMSAAVLLLPTLFIIGLFVYFPVVKTAIMSLYQAAFLGRRRVYAGFDNYVEIFTTGENLATLARTAVMSALIIIGSMAAALFAATLLQVRIRGARFYRLLLIWPIALSTAITGLIFVAVFNPSFGMVNRALSTIGIEPNWLGDPVLAQLVVVLALIWTRFGHNLVFYTAAYQNLPRDVLEAAHVDGASGWQRFRHITFPMLTPISLFLFVTNTVFAFFDSFALIHIMTGGGPLGRTTTLMYDIYENAFVFRRSGLAAAEAMLLFAIVAGLIMWQFRATRSRIHYG